MTNRIPKIVSILSLLTVIVTCMTPVTREFTDREFGTKTSRFDALYDCPRINGDLSLTRPEYYGEPTQFVGGGTFDYPNGSESVGPRTIDCSDEFNNCMQVEDPLPGLEGVIMAPKNIVKSGRYVYRGHTAYIEKYRGLSFSDGKPNSGMLAVIRIPLGAETDDRNIVLVVQDKVGLVAIDGIRMKTAAQTDGSRDRALDIGQCTFVKGKALFSGTRVRLKSEIR